MNNIILQLFSVSKIINGNIILNDINLTIHRKSITGIYGPNGSGKSMLLKIMCGLVMPSSGKVLFNGKPIGCNGVLPESLGILIEQPGLLMNASAYENLKILSQIKKIADDTMINGALAKLGLSAKDKRPVSKYSLGMRQKLGIAQAIFEQPDTIILDEPTNNLDEETSIAVLDILKEMHDQYGTTIILVSHQRAQLDSVCANIIKINDGKII